MREEIKKILEPLHDSDAWYPCMYPDGCNCGVEIAVNAIMELVNKKPESFFDLSEREQKLIINNAAQASNYEQKIQAIEANHQQQIKELKEDLIEWAEFNSEMSIDPTTGLYVVGRDDLLFKLNEMEDINEKSN